MEMKPIRLTRPVAMQLIRGAAGYEVEVELLPSYNPDDVVYLAYTPVLLFECRVNSEFGVYELSITPIGGGGVFRMFFDIDMLCRRFLTEHKAKHDDKMIAVTNWLLTSEPETIRDRYRELRGEEL